MARVHPGPIIRHLHQVVGTQAIRDLTDAQLLGRFLAQGEQDAFALLVRRHGPMVWAVCRHLARREQDAEDAFQATFLVLARRGASIRKREAVASWLYGVAFRTAMKARKRNARRLEHERRAAVPEGTPEPDLGWRELQARLDEALHELPEKYRAPFVLCCLEARPRKDAARELGLQEGTVSSRIARARRLLQAALARRGVALAAALTAGELWRQTAAAALPVELGRRAVSVAMGAETALPAAVAALAQGAAVRALAGVLALLAGLTTAAVFAVGGPSSSKPGAVGAQRGAAEAKPAPAVDAQGDPLPAGAVARLGTLRFRPGGMIRSLAFTPDGKRIVTFGHPRGAHVWDAATGREMAKLPSTQGFPLTGAFLAKDGETVFTTEHGKVYRRRLADFRALGEFVVGSLQPMGLSPDGKLLVGHVQHHASDFSLEVWDTVGGKRLRSWKAHAGWVHGHAFTPDSKTLITWSDDKSIRFWDVAAGAMTFEIAARPAGVALLALSGDGKTLAAVEQAGNASGCRVRLWDVASHKELRALDVPARITALRFAPDGKTLVCGCPDGTLRFWDVQAGKQLRQFPLGFPWVYAFDFAPDGKTIALGQFAVRVIDAATGQDVVKLPGRLNPVHVQAVTPGARTVVLHEEGELTLWDAATGREHGRLGEPGSRLGWAYMLPDGRTVLCQDEKKVLRWLDLTTRKETRHFPLGKPLSNALFAVSSDTRMAALKIGDSDELALIDLTTGREVGRLRGGGPNSWCYGAAFTPDGRTLLTWTGDHTAHVWDVSTRKRVRHFDFADAAVASGRGARLKGPWLDKPRQLSYGARVSPDGRWIAYGSQQGYLALHEVATGDAVRLVGGLRDGPCFFAFTPDGRMLAWAGWSEPAIHLVELASGKERLRLEGHRGRIYSLVFSADGRMLVSSSEDTTALVWDVVGRPGGEDLDTCWADLADADAARAFRAMRRLLHSPAEAVALLAKHLRPVPAADEKRLARLIADLDSDGFADRERAAKELEKLGEAAADACRTALADNPTPEKRRRLERLLKPIDAEARDPSGERLRLTRSVEVLERIRSAEAAGLLKALAAGARGAFLTREAREALARRAGR